MRVERVAVNTGVRGRGGGWATQAGRVGLTAPEHHDHHDEEQHAQDTAGRCHDDCQSAHVRLVFRGQVTLGVYLQL